MLLHHGGQLADGPALLTEHVLCVHGHDDDLGVGGGDVNLLDGVTLIPFSLRFDDGDLYLHAELDADGCDLLASLRVVTYRAEP